MGASFKTTNYPQIQVEEAEKVPDFGELAAELAQTDVGLGPIEAMYETWYDAGASGSLKQHSFSKVNTDLRFLDIMRQK